MKCTIIVTDTFVRFRFAAMEDESPRPATWELEVMTIEQAAETPVSLGLFDTAAAHRLTQAITTITPQQGLTTVPFAAFAALVEFVHPEDEPASPEAKEGDVPHHKWRNDRRVVSCCRMRLAAQWPTAIKNDF